MSETTDGDTRPLPTGIQLTNLDPAFREDPYPILADLRAREPVHHDRELGRYLLTRHDDVHAVLYDLELWSDPRRSNPETFSRRFLHRGDEEPSMLLMDDPGHKRLRGLVRRSFTPRAIELWRGRVRAVAERLVAALPEGRFDAIGDFADTLPTVVIAEMLGLDPDNHAEFKAWSDDIAVAGFNPAPKPEEVDKAERARVCIDALLQSELEARRAQPGDDLMSDMVQTVLDGDQLTDVEIVRQCNLLLLAGNLTTTDLIGNAIKAFIDHPDQQALLRAKPALLENAVEEVLRYDSPVTNSGRIAHRDLEFGGIQIAKGENLAVSTAAANRDPAVYPDPDRFDIEREDTHHHAFGGGRHFCLGAHLARMEAQEALRALFARFDRLSQDAAGYRYATTPTFRGHEYLWVAV